MGLYYDMNLYQKEAKKTAIYPGQGTFDGLLYTALGLAGEAGEFANKVKKILRDCPDREYDLYIKEKLMEELGDVIWYASQIAEELDVEFSQIAEANITKLLDRKKRDKLHGSGDNR